MPLGREPLIGVLDPHRRAHRIVFLFPVLFLAVNVALFLLAEPWYRRACLGEERALEWLQVAAYLGAAGATLDAARRARRLPWGMLALVLGGWGLALLFVTGEELAWGQRILGYEPPRAFQEHNRQYEVTLHNLRGVQRKVGYAVLAVTTYASFAWAVVPGPLLRLWRGLPTFAVPGPRFALYFLPNTIYYPALLAQNRWTDVRLLRMGQQELFEACLALGILAFALASRRRVLTSEATLRS